MPGHAPVNVSEEVRMKEVWGERCEGGVGRGAEDFEERSRWLTGGGTIHPRSTLLLLAGPRHPVQARRIPRRRLPPDGHPREPVAALADGGRLRQGGFRSECVQQVGFRSECVQQGGFRSARGVRAGRVGLSLGQGGWDKLMSGGTSVPDPYLIHSSLQVAITSAVGFDTFVVMRHGAPPDCGCVGGAPAASLPKGPR